LKIIIEQQKVEPYKPENKLSGFHIDDFTRRTVPAAFSFVKCRWYSAPIRITGAYVYNIMGGRKSAHKGKRRHYLSHGFMIFRYAKTAALCGAKQICLVRFAGGDTRLILMIIFIKKVNKTGEQK
jgi:hypothetical protein